MSVNERETWEGTTKGSPHPRPLQDQATRAWNQTALYYKAGGTPWRMPRHSTDLPTCYVGVSFYRTPDGEELHTAVAQVFNERGDGVVVRGGTAKISKTDRRPHLTEADARKLLNDALAEYRRTHGHQPARIVLHKTSQFSAHEIGGFQGAADDRDIDFLELLWIQRRGAPHLFRTGQLPPLRGISVQLDKRASCDASRIAESPTSVPTQRHVCPPSQRPLLSARSLTLPLDRPPKRSAKTSTGSRVNIQVPAAG